MVDQRWGIDQDMMSDARKAYHNLMENGWLE